MNHHAHTIECSPPHATNVTCSQCTYPSPPPTPAITPVISGSLPPVIPPDWDLLGDWPQYEQQTLQQQMPDSAFLSRGEGEGEKETMEEEEEDWWIEDTEEEEELNEEYVSDEDGERAGEPEEKEVAR